MIKICVSDMQAKMSVKFYFLYTTGKNVSLPLGENHMPSLFHILILISASYVLINKNAPMVRQYVDCQPQFQMKLQIIIIS